MKVCKCGQPIYNDFKECDMCFLKKLKTPAEKNMFLQGNFYEPPDRFRIDRLGIRFRSGNIVINAFWQDLSPKGRGFRFWLKQVVTGLRFSIGN
jgi:hypothetical protein